MGDLDRRRLRLRPGAAQTTVVDRLARGEDLAVDLVTDGAAVLADVDRVARLVLAARRCPGRLALRLPRDLLALVELAGLAGSVQVHRHPEPEEDRVAEEVVDVPDAVAVDLDDLDRPG